ncbi:MAG: gamma-glutamyl-gamma-aminobutyrate hydrolase family protein [Candidatus Saccharimonadaceae bacterium]
MKPLIGITTKEIINQSEPWEASIYGQKRTYSEAVVAAGGIPIFIPFIPKDELKNLYERLDGILFAGGNDIDPLLYGQAPTPLTIEVSPERDYVESMLINWALADNKPIFAICRGFQLLNVQLGGNLYQDIPTELASADDHEISTKKQDYAYIAHVLKIAPNSRLATITKSLDIMANSHHHQAIQKLADALQPTAWSEDGIIEAVEHPNRLFVVGVQCHPESLYTIDEKWTAVFNAFIEASSRQFIPKRIFGLRRRRKALPNT